MGGAVTPIRGCPPALLDVSAAVFRTETESRVPDHSILWTISPVVLSFRMTLVFPSGIRSFLIR